MELSPGQRKAAFAVIVLAFAALGAFLLVSRLTHVPASRPAAAASSPARQASQAPASQAPASPVQSASPAASQPAAGVDIYRLLPFSQQALDQAVGVAERFGSAYGTYSYRQNASSYVAGLRGLATPQLAATLARSYATPGVAQTRVTQQQVSAGRGTVTALRAFGPASMTFVVTVVQEITQKQGQSRQSTQYAVTVTDSSGHWQVSDIQLASAGNS